MRSTMQGGTDVTIRIATKAEVEAADSEAAVELWGQISKELRRSVVDATDYVDLARRAAKLARELDNEGFPVRLLDEDGESMIVYADLSSGAAELVIHYSWDDDVGAGVYCEHPKKE